YYSWGINRILHACWEINCQARSHNGLDRAIIEEDKIIQVPFYGNFSGEGVLFPPIQNIVTIWSTTSDKVTISLHEFKFFPDEPSNTIAETTLRTNTVYPNSGAWSPNGRLLAFADTDGIYLWDVFTPNSQPQLVITTDIKTIQGFSPLGTYLVVGNDADGFTVDLISKNVYPAGVFSPDESSMITYGDFRQIYFRPYAIYEGYEEFLPIHEIHWLDNRVWQLVTCEDIAIKESCELVYGCFRGFIPSISGGRMYARNAVTGSSVTVIDDYQIRISGQSYSDLSPYLDSPIASIEWLPSLFYYDD
ncbi:MAG TPA: WD40 repeat domain-containing protein, partial [Aggregatilineales bacterium]|nr:WD40 repeat domain-containing protein [Aggregatilineales bacterium]